MALFTDGPINTSGDLRKYESAILNVASTEGIDLTAKAFLAQEEIGTDLRLFLRRSVPADPRFLLRRDVATRDIVVTPPLQRWHAYRTLALTYRDAYNNQLNDRYKGKWTAYDNLTAEAAHSLFVAGVGMVRKPVTRATPASITLVPASISGASYYVRISWINAEGEEGAPGDVVQATSTDGSAISVATSEVAEGVASWNVYAGSAPDNTSRQNAAPLALNETWVAPASGLVAGRSAGNGQEPEFWVIDKHVLPRG